MGNHESNATSNATNNFRPQYPQYLPVIAQRKYYPVSGQHQYNVAEFVKSHSEMLPQRSNHQLSLNFTQDYGSPVPPKKARTGVETVWNSYQELSPRELISEPFRMAQSECEGGSTRDPSFLEPAPPVKATNSNETEMKMPGPITKAVLTKGLKARFKSVSEWVLSPRVECKEPPTIVSNSKSYPVGLKRWTSLKTQLRSSWSYLGSPLKLVRRGSSLRSVASTFGRKSQQSEIIETDRESVGSLNSLIDGRTPWPIPWLDAIFLPDFPHKGPVNEKAFQILGIIARGAFGKVYRVALKSDAQNIYAMKVQRKAEVIAHQAIGQVKQEVAIQFALSDCPFVAQLHYAWQNRTSLYMVLQYVQGFGDLFDLWRDEGPFSEEISCIFAAELALALDFMHNRSVIFRDLKLENVLLDENGHCQIVDFGLAKWLAIGDRTRTICGTLQYMAPEIASGQPYDHSVDWWCLGVIMHLLLTGHYPFPPAQDHLTKRYPDYEPGQSLSPEMQTLLRKLLANDEQLRISSLNSLRALPIFGQYQIDFTRIQERQMNPFDLLPKMKRCDSCNVEEDLDSVIEGSSQAFHESYDIYHDFDITMKTDL